jgi:hypothetical protein
MSTKHAKPAPVVAAYPWVCGFLRGGHVRAVPENMGEFRP